MRYAIAVAITLFLLPAAAGAWECHPGTYKGKTYSVTHGLHQKDATLKVTKSGETCTMKFDAPDAETWEIWELTGNRLVQQDLDKKGKLIQKYGATLEVRDGQEGYFVDCKDKGKCDAKVDNRYFWRIETPKDRVVYSVWGVAPAKQNDPAAQPRKRHEYDLKLVP
jgi:hypothetical protein